MITILAYAFVVAVALGLLHWMYEGAMAPTLRVGLRYRVYALRDQLRRMKVERGAELDDAAFGYLQDGLNAVVRALPRFDPWLLYQMHQVLKADPGLRTAIEQRQGRLDACQLEEFQEIRRQLNGVLRRAMLVNVGGLLPYAFVLLAVLRLALWAQAKLLWAQGELLTVLPHERVEALLPGPAVA